MTVKARTARLARILLAISTNNDFFKELDMHGTAGQDDMEPDQFFEEWDGLGAKEDEDKLEKGKTDQDD